MGCLAALAAAAAGGRAAESLVELPRLNSPPPPPPPTPPPSPPPAPLPFYPLLTMPFLHPNGADSDSDYITDSDATIPYSPMDFDENDILWQ